MEKYRELSDKQVFIEVWKMYENLHNGDWVQWGNYPEDGEFMPKTANREKAWVVLQNAFERLKPFEESIVSDFEARNWPLSNDEAWLESAYNICKEFHTQQSVMAMTIQDTQNTEKAPETVTERPQSEELPTLEQLLPKEIKEAENGIAIFQWAVDESLFTLTSEGLRWSKSHSLYGCFIELVSAKLRIRPSNNRIPWRKFAFVANHEAIKQNARDAVNYARNKSGEDPVGSETIKDYLDSL